MPDLSTLLRLQAGYNDQQMDASGRLMQTIGGIVQDRGQRSFQQDAIEFFKDGNISPERLQQFSQMYPNVDPQETWKVAAAVGSQVKAQKMKNYGAAIVEAWKQEKEKGGTLTEDRIREIIPPEDVAEFMPHVSKLAEYFRPVVTDTKLNKGEKVYRSIGGKTPEVYMENKDESNPASKYKLDEIVTYDGPGGTKKQRTVTGFDKNGKAIFSEEVDVTATDTDKDSGVFDTIYGPNNQTKKVFIKKGSDYVPPAGWSLKAPGEPDKPDKPERVPYRDTVDGSIKYYDKNNPQDRKTLEKYGNQLVPLAENPIQNIIRQGLQGAATSPAESQPAKAAKGKAEKDSFGYTVGEIAKGKDGKQYKYIGNDKWQKL